MTAVFHHVGMVAKDPIAIEKFYTKYFDFKRERVYAPGPDQVVVLKSGVLGIEIFKAEQESPAMPTGAGPMHPCWRHICFLVDDLDAKIAELGSEATLTHGPVDMGVFVEGMKVAWLADPEGNIFELNQGYTPEDNPPQMNDM
jgi:glyoxylase I family protein